jgi:hypothetical protein
MKVFLVYAMGMDDLEFMWLVGLLEGEGTFAPVRSKRARKNGSIYRTCYPRIQIQTNDQDIANRVANLLKANVLGPYSNNRSSRPSYGEGKDCWVVSVARAETEDLLRRMSPHMSSRRQEQIAYALIESTRKCSKESM